MCCECFENHEQTEGGRGAVISDQMTMTDGKNTRLMMDILHAMLMLMLCGKMMICNLNH